ncbi:MAG: hypothetical protein MRERC_1c214 [Mycoplasmataceae bacterium RC_NB112A]|nr:MAG: hypothetical protein MRERC_1c214 [Mycoplasmataceae bacterium RC_NB112A]
MSSSFKKKISWWLLLVLVVAVFTGGIILSVRGNNKKNVYHSLTSPVNLTQVRNEKISQINKQLSTYKLTDEMLFQKVKTEQLISPKESSWENYLHHANSLSELENRVKKIFKLLTQLKETPSNPTPNPNPQPNNPPRAPNSPPPSPQSPTPNNGPNSQPPFTPTPPSPGPTGPSPETTSTNQWEKKLAEFRSFYEKILPFYNQICKIEEELLEKKATKRFGMINNLKVSWASVKEEDKTESKNLIKNFCQKVENFLRENQALENLTGVDLKGAEKEKLQKLPQTGSLPSSDNPEIVPYKDWVRLKSSRDGNCTLNSFSILLKGYEDKDLIIQLRLALFYKIMKKVPNWDHDIPFSDFNDTHFFCAKRLSVNYNSLPIGLMLDEMTEILKRDIILIEDSPIIVIYRKSTNPSYSKPFVIYSTAIHAEPLIEK